MLDGADTVRDAAAPSVKLPDQHGFKPTQPSVLHQPIQFRAAGLGTAEAGVHILGEHFPALPDYVLTQFVKLHFAALVRGADTGVDGNDHEGDTMSAHPQREVNCPSGLEEYRFKGTA